jgi:hypothetical protein
MLILKGYIYFFKISLPVIQKLNKTREYRSLPPMISTWNLFQWKVLQWKQQIGRKWDRAKYGTWLYLLQNNNICSCIPLLSYLQGLNIIKLPYFFYANRTNNLFAIEFPVGSLYEKEKKYAMNL